MKARYVCTVIAILIILITYKNHNTIFFLIFIWINLLYPSINFTFLLFLSELVHDTGMIVICSFVTVFKWVAFLFHIHRYWPRAWLLYNSIVCSSRLCVRAASCMILVHNMQNLSKDCQIRWCLTRNPLSYLSFLSHTLKEPINCWIKRESRLILLRVKTHLEVSYII